MTLTHLSIILGACGVLALGGTPLVVLTAAVVIAYLTQEDA